MFVVTELLVFELKVSGFDIAGEIVYVRVNEPQNGVESPQLLLFFVIETESSAKNDCVDGLLGVDAITKVMLDNDYKLHKPPPIDD